MVAQVESNGCVEVRGRGGWPIAHLENDQSRHQHRRACQESPFSPQAIAIFLRVDSIRFACRFQEMSFYPRSLQSNYIFYLLTVFVSKYSNNDELWLNNNTGLCTLRNRTERTNKRRKKKKENLPDSVDCNQCNFNEFPNDTFEMQIAYRLFTTKKFPCHFLSTPF